MRCRGGYARIKASQAAVTGTRETAKGMFSWFGFGFWHVWKGGTACCASGDIPTGGRQGLWFRKTAADLVTVVRFDHPRYVKVSLLSEGLIRVYNASSTSAYEYFSRGNDYFSRRGVGKKAWSGAWSGLHCPRV